MSWGGRVPGCRQIYIAAQVLANFVNGGASEGPFTVPSFLVMTPDSRLRTKVTILFSGNGIVWPAALGTLSLIEMEQDYAGGSGTLIQSVAVDPPAPGGTIALPLAPTLLGYSREFVTAGDAIQGNLVVGPGIGNGGKVVVQARWQPDGQRLPADEWDELVTFCSIQVPQVNI